MSETGSSQDTEARITHLLDNQTLSRIGQLRIQSRRKCTDRRSGEHLSGISGDSNEFSDYRNYVEGDDIRKVDWNIFARLRQPFIKLFHEEEELHVACIIDNSSSMVFEDKFIRSLQLGLAFGFMGLMGGEQVSIFLANEPKTGEQYLKPLRGRGSLKDVVTFMERCSAGGDVPVEEAITGLLRYHSGRGIAVVLSDFLTFGDLKSSFNRLFHAGLEIFCIQVMGPSEIEPDISGDIALIDSESSAKMDISAGTRLINLYQEYRSAYEQNLSAMCRRRLGRFMHVSTAENAETIIFDSLLRKGWVK